ncbi:permease [Denitrobaculum tricleocarpae]|uniref:Permease n=1 Tax=Denitrobaculum tricleocarpae TaxID=2591009 RepID=A0A545U309_9PROT|nr:permease [Denitrobaculum tricleocarpae]TQV83838.1 permease [Denitrobaculum tricleocarpae]
MSLDLPKRAAERGFPPLKSLVKLGFLLAVVTAALLWPGHAWAATVFALKNLILILPMIALGLFLTAGVHASGSMALIAAAFRGRPVRMILLAALIGALTPVCGVSVLPLVAGLLAGGVPLAPIMAFWLSSPITDPGMLAITAGTLGSSFAIGKTLSAFVIGLFGGSVTAVIIAAGRFRHPAKASLSQSLGKSCGTASGCSEATHQDLYWRFWHSAARRKTFLTSCLGNGRLMITWLFAAFIAEYALQLFLPPDFVGRFASGDDWWSVPAAAVVGAPIYLDGYAALPLIRALIDSGMGQGPAMAFLIAGGITSAWAAIPVFALVRLPVFLFYVVMAVLSAILCGWLFGLALSLMA